MTLEEQLSSAGHARVLLVLKPQKNRRVDGRTALALDETIALQQEAAHTLRPCFKEFRNSRTATLARELSAARAARGVVFDFAPDPGIETVGDTDAIDYYPNLGVMLGTVDAAGLAALADNGKEVRAVMPAPDFTLIRPFEEDDAALAGPPPGESWALQRIKAPALWDKGFTGAGVTVGHLDTGVDKSHPAIKHAVDAFAHFDLTGKQVEKAPAVDSKQHGTHTAGIIAGKPFGGSTFGVAPGASLASALVIEGGDKPKRIFAGLNWCVGQGVRIINISLGLTIFEASLSAVIRIVRQRGILPVAAIGNEGFQTSRTPGNLPESLSVGATDELDNIWFNSSSQLLPETPKRNVPSVIAPGAMIWSSVPGAGMKALSGTSMAAPHITGLAALLMEAKPDKTIDEIEKAIFASCARPDHITTARGNRGIPDGVAALEAL
jgi:subtilisin family serine protease